MRLRNIDLIKGILIILVIVGHILLGSTEKSFVRYLIYCFHIPLFIGVSGFLFNYDKIGEQSLWGFIYKYLFRIILPWVIAVVVYKLILNFNVFIQTWDYRILTGAFKLPYNHLWFIAAYFSWVTMTWIAKKMHIPLPVLLLISLIMVISVQILKKNPFWDVNNPNSTVYSSLIFQIYRPHLYIYFVAGMFLRKIQLRINSIFILGIVLSLFSLVVASFFLRFSFITWLLYLFNLSFLILLINYARRDVLVHSKFIEWIGANSMGVYLWHMIPLIIVSQHVAADKVFLYYSLSLISSAIFVVLIYFLSKLKFINRYFFGMNG